MKKVTTLLLALCLTIGLVACGGDKKTEEKKTEPLSLVGEWQEAQQNSTYHIATITDDTIKVYWYTPKDETKALYWEGTYEPPKDDAKTYEWTSKANREALDSSLLASRDSEKKFAYDGKYLTYEVTAMGVTKKVRLEKVK